MEYESLPIICYSCGKYGHGSELYKEGPGGKNQKETGASTSNEVSGKRREGDGIETSKAGIDVEMWITGNNRRKSKFGVLIDLDEEVVDLYVLDNGLRKFSGDQQLDHSAEVGQCFIFKEVSKQVNVGAKKQRNSKPKGKSEFNGSPSTNGKRAHIGEVEAIHIKMMQSHASSMLQQVDILPTSETFVCYTTFNVAKHMAVCSLDKENSYAPSSSRLQSFIKTRLHGGGRPHDVCPSIYLKSKLKTKGYINKVSGKRLTDIALHVRTEALKIEDILGDLVDDEVEEEFSLGFVKVQLAPFFKK
ncbi:conserved hypothetical protein [Ricinus communis]|uniref:CCHC-type domain-containing protein n=1 Tax=Ricinus communis TaxID=3988 RepID=B9RX89_RICCO|nr:conserved hypothetical protein [Ricinus communis]